MAVFISFFVRFSSISCVYVCVCERESVCVSLLFFIHFSLLIQSIKLIFFFNLQKAWNSFRSSLPLPKVCVFVLFSPFSFPPFFLPSKTPGTPSGRAYHYRLCRRAQTPFFCVQKKNRHHFSSPGAASAGLFFAAKKKWAGSKKKRGIRAFRGD